MALPSPRIVVVGTCGSGKSTYAARLASVLRVQHVELDSLHWEANWTQVALEEFRRRAEDATRGTSWVVDGNYAKVRDVVWRDATDIVWLGYSWGRTMRQPALRTFRHVVTRQRLWAGNRESFSTTFFQKDYILLWHFVRTAGTSCCTRE